MRLVVRLLARLVAVVGLAAPRAHLEPLVNLLAIRASLVLTLLVLVEGREFAAAVLRGVTVPEDVSLEAVHEALAQGKGDLEEGVLAQHLLKTALQTHLVLLALQAVLVN